MADDVHELEARIAEAFAVVRSRIDTAARRVGRDPGTIEIVAASKLRTPKEIAAARAGGITRFGENRVQEWRDKHAACSDDVRWDLIGPLQRNKVRLAVGRFELLQAIDRHAVAEAVSAVAVERGLVQRILLEVNVSGEPSKHGVAPDEAVAAATTIADLPGIELAGLMTVGDPERPAPGFARLAALGEQIRRTVPSLVELSMGMSADLEAAIEHGATIVRPGTALFGPRPAMP